MNPVANLQATALAFGGAVRLRWTAPAEATFDHVKVLRKTVPGFTGPADPAATVVYVGKGQQVAPGPINRVIHPWPETEDPRNRNIFDTAGVTWATTFYYAVYATNAAESDWSAAATVSATTPEISAFEEPDLVGILLGYLDAYFQRQVAVGALRLRSGQTKIELHDAPPLIDNVKLPCLSVHLDADEPAEFAVGDRVHRLDDLGDAVVNRRGHQTRQTVRLVVWTDNPELRRTLYRMLKSAVVSARPLLSVLGANNLTVSGQYLEDFTTYHVPMFMGALTLTATLVTAARAVPVAPAIAEIDVQPPVVAAVQP